MGSRAGRERVLGKGLPHLKHLAGALTPIVVGRHGSEDTGTGGAQHRTMWTCGWPPESLPRIWSAPFRRRCGSAVGLVSIPRRPDPGIRVHRTSTDCRASASACWLASSTRSKGVIPVAITLVLAGRPEAHAVWTAAVAGHVWPFYRRFRGGKGVATAGGGGLVLSPLVGLACAVLFFSVVMLGRVAAVGSLSIALGYPIITAAIGRPGWRSRSAAVSQRFSSFATRPTSDASSVVPSKTFDRRFRPHRRDPCGRRRHPLPSRYQSGAQRAAHRG